MSSSYMCGHSDSSKLSASSSARRGDGSSGSALDEEAPDKKFTERKIPAIQELRLVASFPILAGWIPSACVVPAKVLLDR